MIPGPMIFGFVMVAGAWLGAVWRMAAHVVNYNDRGEDQ